MLKNFSGENFIVILNTRFHTANFVRNQLGISGYPDIRIFQGQGKFLENIASGMADFSVAFSPL
jgi:hypothetical protein